eukprot:6324678-Karenia_brevis.AAC.1
MHLFCYARSTPPRVAGVLFHNHKVTYFDEEPPANILKFFSARNDGQSTSLELLATAYGAHSSC